jgi:hypothetical protein
MTWVTALKPPSQMRICAGDGWPWPKGVTDLNGSLTRFLGDSPLRVLFKLIVVSFIVGILMSAFGWTPYDIYYGVRDFFWHLWNMGFRAIDRFVAYFLLGAAIVIPAFIILRVLSYRR